MIRVIIADDFTAIEKVMERMIERAEDMELAGSAALLGDAVEELFGE